jgi:hypothetical protein
VYLPCDCKDAEIGRRWREDNSLHKWFPITAERLAALEAKNAELTREAHEWWTACADATKTQEELAMMVRMLTSSLKRHWPHAPQPGDLPSRAMDLLRRHNLMGSPLRDESNNLGPQQGA